PALPGPLASATYGSIAIVAIVAVPRRGRRRTVAGTIIAVLIVAIPLRRSRYRAQGQKAEAQAQDGGVIAAVMAAMMTTTVTIGLRGGGGGSQQRQGKSCTDQAFHGLRSFPLRALRKRGWTSSGVVGMDYGPR